MQFQDYDWTEIVFDLKRLGMDHVQIVGALNGCVTERALRRYMEGSQPTHWRGEMLLTLWAERMGKPRDEAPIRIAPIRIQAAGR